MKKYYDFSRYIPDKERELVEDDELDNNFIDPRRSKLKIKKMAKEQSRFSKNELLHTMADLPTFHQFKQKHKKLQT